ncbi:MAG: hydrolase 1, exosortase A system-associated [Methylibium sp.]|nr:hydrolase 1, exosortase A system-associated [Methylibium sp.]
MTGYRESVLPIRCADSWLTGVLAAPTGTEKAPETAVLIVVGGPQYRAGSHRQFVLLSRSLAAAGHLALRFDYRGMGDSGGELRNFEDVSADLGAAIDTVQAAHPGIQRFVLWGLCDGASAALLYLNATRDTRVGGLCLVNPWVRSELSQAKTQLKHYYLARLRQREFWLKLLSGKVAATALRELLQNIRIARAGPAPGGQDSKAKPITQQPYQQRMAQGLSTFAGSTLVLLSTNDYTAKEFLDHSRSDAAWSQAMQHTRVGVRQLEGADHTCSDPAAQTDLENSTLQWLGTL